MTEAGIVAAAAAIVAPRRSFPQPVVFVGSMYDMFRGSGVDENRPTTYIAYVHGMVSRVMVQSERVKLLAGRY